MTHHHIRHIDDVLPHLAGHPEFVVAQRPGYTVIDYQYVTAASFDHPARIECRGLKFGPDGRLIARPLHKFHNVGEKPHTQPDVLDFSRPHTVMEKLDGSMIHPAIVDGRVVFMTRMGRTDHAIKAERHLTWELERECRGMLEAGLTTIFEWTAPDNRIVLTYPDSRLTLLAVRQNMTGEYERHDALFDLAMFMGVDPVPLYTTPGHHSPAAFLEYARAVRGMEGFVIRFDDGLWVKAKGEDYVLKHKAKESVLQEKNVLALILRDGLDDVLPLLDPADKADVERYRDAVLAGVQGTADALAQRVADNADKAQKYFALFIVPTLPPAWRSLAFTIRAGGDPRATVAAAILKQCGSASGVDSVRALFGAHSFRPANDNAAMEQVP